MKFSNFSIENTKLLSILFYIIESCYKNELVVISEIELCADGVRKYICKQAN